MKLSKRILALALAVVTAVSVFSFASCSGDDIEVPEFSAETIKIGVSGPLTGAAAVYGQAVYNGARLAIHEINEAGGLDGTLFSFEMFDDTHDPTKVATGYASLTGKGMQLSLGTVTTGPGLEFKELSKTNMFVLTPSASGDKIPEYANAYQMCFADGNQGKVAAEYVNSLCLTKIGIFYKTDEDYSKGIYDQFKANLSSSIQTVEASFTDSNATDFSTQIDTLKDCTFIFMPIYYTPASLFMTQAKDKIAKNATYYGCDGFDGIESAEGFDITTIPQNVSMLSHFNSKAESGAAKDFVTKYTDIFGADTLNQFGASAYDCVYAIFNALKAAKAAGKTVDGSTSSADMLAILTEQFNGGFTYSGVTGDNIKWEPTGYVNKGAVPYTIKEANE
ncbi:MAG: ABC transporter substrate-binding protein [Clostridia bacterium]|nr:ABC transporter substrate-binding protein [Clostridia bacterium]